MKNNTSLFLGAFAVSFGCALASGVSAGAIQYHPSMCHLTNFGVRRNSNNGVLGYSAAGIDLNNVQQPFYADCPLPLEVGATGDVTAYVAGATAAGMSLCFASAKAATDIKCLGLQGRDTDRPGQQYVMHLAVTSDAFPSLFVKFTNRTSALLGYSFTADPPASTSSTDP